MSVPARARLLDTWTRLISRRRRDYLTIMVTVRAVDIDEADARLADTVESSPPMRMTTPFGPTVLP